MQKIIQNAILMILKNWFTSALGTIAGVPEIIQGLSSKPINWSLVLKGISIVLLGLAAKDANVAGVPRVFGGDPKTENTMHA